MWTSIVHIAANFFEELKITTFILQIESLQELKCGSRNNSKATYRFYKFQILPSCCCQVSSVVSNSVKPHRHQPTRLPHPWDSPGKNTGVGCHFLLQCMKVKSESEVAQSCLTQRPHGLQPPRLLHPWDFPGKSTGVGCHCLLRLRSIESIKC